jgi:uncharacterized protein
MSKDLPEIIDPFAFVEKKRIIEGSYPLACMERLRDVLSDASGEVRFRLEFGREDPVSAVRGTIAAETRLQCQVCLSPMNYHVDASFALGLVSSIDEANLLTESFEPLLMGTEPTLRVLDLVEDELLLSLPQVPRHEECVGKGRSETPAAVEQPATVRPFADLGSLVKLNIKKEPR